MAYGSEYGTIIGEVRCPRCNAPAKIRGKRKETNSRRLLTFIVCEKCHLIRFNGMTRIENVVMDRLVKTMKKSRDRAKTEEERNKLDRRLAALEERRRYKDLGL